MNRALTLFLFSTLLRQYADAATGLPFLDLAAGARSHSLGEATVALYDVEAATSNPATVRSVGGLSLAFTRATWFPQIRHDYLTLATGNRISAWSLSLNLSHTSNLEHRTRASAFPQGKFGVYEGILSLAHARSWGQCLRWGINVKMIRQTIFTQAATGTALDWGLLFKLSPCFKVGLALRNFGSMNALDRETTPLPRTIHAGFSAQVNPGLCLVGAVRQLVEGGMTMKMGGEYTMRQRIILRAGYQTATNRSFSLGVGLMNSNWNVDYAVVPFDNNLGTAHRISLHLQRRS